MYCPKCSDINYPFEMKKFHCTKCGFVFPGELLSKLKVDEQSEKIQEGMDEFRGEWQEEPMLKWFEYKHLPGDLRLVSQDFAECAHCLCDACEPGPERTVALRKLLEAKDAAVRSKLHPGQ